MRSGFEAGYERELIVAAGISLFLLFAPLLVSSYLKSGFLLKSEGILLLIFLAALSILHFVPYIVNLIILIGFASFGICLYSFVSDVRFTFRTVGFVLLGVYFSVWVLFTVWAVHRPTFFESLAFNRKVFQAQDLFFHATISQMIKNYGTASTGLQGTPHLYYHFGSHWFFAQISKLTDIHVVRLYIAFFPFVVVPCFFKSFLTFSRLVQKVLLSNTNFTFLSFIAFFCVFLGIPDHLYARGLFDASILAFESLTLSFLLMFALASAWIELYLKRPALVNFSGDEKIFLLIISPSFFCAIGLIKISTLFVMLAPFTFLIFRFNRLTDLVGASFFFTVICAAGAYFTVAETIPFGIRTHGHEGSLSFAGVYAAMERSEIFHPFDWFGMFFLWTYLAIAISIFFKKKHALSVKLNGQGITVVLIVASVSAVAGLLPSFLFSFNGANAIFFMTVQGFISGAFLIAVAPAVQDILMKNKISMVSFFVCSLFLLGVVNKRIRFTAKEVLLENLNTRIYISGNSDLPKIRFSLNHDLALIYNGFSNLQSNVDLNKLYQFVKRAEEMGTHHDPTRASTLLFVEDYANGEVVDGTEELNCLEKTFLLPALSGYAMLNGAIYNCSIESYGASYYRYPGKHQESAKTTVCADAATKGFDKVLRLNAKNNTQLLVECKD